MELIDKYSLVGANGLFSKRGCYGNCNNCSLWSEEGCRVILEAPTVDAVEVVRCEHCRFRIDRKDGTYGCYRNFMEDCRLDDFCSRGERSIHGKL